MAFTFFNPRRNFKAGRFALISADELIVAHTNETEYRSFISIRKMKLCIHELL